MPVPNPTPPTLPQVPFSNATEGSSLLMVPYPVGWPIVAPAGDDNLTVNNSGTSTVASPLIVTPTKRVVAPAVKVNVPDVAVKSLPDVAVPDAVAKCTET